MTSMPASRSARAMIFAPRSWPSRPGLATTTRILRFSAMGARHRTARFPVDDARIAAQTGETDGELAGMLARRTASGGEWIGVAGDRDDHPGRCDAVAPF